MDERVEAKVCPITNGPDESGHLAGRSGEASNKYEHFGCLGPLYDPKNNFLENKNM